MAMNDVKTKTGIIIVDHGSKQPESNSLLEQIAAEFRQRSAYKIVEPAHMEIASPSIADAFEKCVEQGAEKVVVFPFFLLPGVHLQEDIPRLVKEAAAACGDVDFAITGPIGTHDLINQIIASRINEVLGG